MPAFTKFKQFFVSEYLPACYDKVGAWHLPHGEELYAQMIRHYTTTNETPEEVHHIGLKESRGSFTARGEDERIEAP